MAGVDEHQTYVYITEHSGLLCHLLPGDVILADRGFNIQEAAGMYCAEVKIPPVHQGEEAAK